MTGGVGLLFSRGFTPSFLEVEHLVKGRCMLVKARLQKHTLVFINIYAPTYGTQRKSFLDKVCMRLNGCGAEEFLWGMGILTAQYFFDRNNAEPHPASQYSLRQLIYSHVLVDVWMRMHPENRQYTRSQMSDDRIASARLDRFYCFRHHFIVFRGCKITPVGFTDHSLVLGEVALKNILAQECALAF